MSEDRKVTWLVDGSGFLTRVEPFPKGCKMNLSGCVMKFCFGAIDSFFLNLYPSLPLDLNMSTTVKWIATKCGTNIFPETVSESLHVSDL